MTTRTLHLIHVPADPGKDVTWIAVADHWAALATSAPHLSPEVMASCPK